LDEAIERAIRVYEKERRHSAPADVVAQNIGYKNANNGAALSVLASLRYYGLLERPQEGLLAVSKDVEAYQFAPSETVRHEVLIRWLKNPQVFSDLLKKYEDGLPSDATLRFDLIQRGFNPVAAESVIAVFKRSVVFAKYYEMRSTEHSAAQLVDAVSDSGAAKLTHSEQRPDISEARGGTPDESVSVDAQSPDLDRIPVRLSGGRRAWLVIPTPFFAADKQRLKAQIDFLLTEDDEGSLNKGTA